MKSEAEYNKVLQDYNLRLKEESDLMASLSAEEGMNRRNEFLLSVGEEAAQFINRMVKSAKPKIILELGTSYGYSTLYLAEAAQSIDAKVITLDIYPEKSDFARQKINQAGLGSYVDFVTEDAVKYLKNSNLTFDFVLVDLWKELYCPCFELFLPKLSNGAYIISDNMLFPPHHTYEMEAYRKYIRTFKNIETVLIPIGAGLEISQFKIPHS